VVLEENELRHQHPAVDAHATRREFADVDVPQSIVQRGFRGRSGSGQDFVDKINSKDKASATSLVCPGSEGDANSYIDKATSGSPNITVDLNGTGDFLTGSVKRTFHGKDAGGIVPANNAT
jgi:hypothetical protein